jgi:hypothetical protein
VTRDANFIKGWTNNRKHVIFPLLAFAIPLIVRIVPEILMGPYSAGFDTIAYYVPIALLWLHHGVNLWSFFATAPLFYAIYVPLVSAIGSPVLLIKIISPLLLAFLSLSIFAFAKTSLGWSSPKSTFVAVLGTIYFVALRTSWDQLREELSLVFLFVVLILLVRRKSSSWRNYVLLSLAMLAVVLSDQIGAVVMFGVVILTLIPELYHKKYRQAVSMIIFSLPATVYFLVFYIGYFSLGNFLGHSNAEATFATWTGFASYQSMLISEGGFFLFCFLLLFPLSVIGLKKLRNLQLRSWLLFSFILMFVPTTSVSSFRWELMLVYPFAFYTTEAVSWLRKFNWKRWRLNLQRIALAYLVLSTAILSFGFMFNTSEQPFVYFNPAQINAFVNQIPSSMLQNTVPLADCQSTVNALQWFKDNVSSSSALLLTHAAFYGWALLTLNDNRVKDYGFDNPDTIASTLANEGYTQIYLIWWANGRGWYGQPTVPPAFHQLYRSGDIAIYRYNPN